MKELIELLGNNISKLVYSNETNKWTIYCKNDLEPNIVDTENLIEFLTNA